MGGCLHVCESMSRQAASFQGLHSSLMSACLPLPLPPAHPFPQVVAAGNSYESACLMSPASSPWVISVAASDDQDRRWAQSNW